MTIESTPHHSPNVNSVRYSSLIDRVSLRTLRTPPSDTWCSIMRSARVVTISAIIVIAVVILSVSLVITFSPNSGGPPNYVNHLIDNIDTDNIRKYVEALSHPNKPGGEVDVATYIYENWIQQGLEDVQFINHTVLLSLPPEKSNTIKLVNKEGNTIFTSNSTLPNITPDLTDEEFGKIPPAYVAFSGEGKFKGPLIYINYGRDRDIQEVESFGIDLKDSILIARFSEKIFPGNVVRLAEEKHAKGVVFYIDPADVVTSSPLYPDGVSATEDTYKFMTLRLQGDLLSPGIPAIDGSSRLPISDADIPTLPVHTISYSDARVLFSYLEGEEAPEEFVGGLDLPYHLGPDIKDDSEAVIEVFQNLEIKSISSVMGVVKGHVEPDHYIIIGGHHDSWGVGGSDPSTSILLEVSRSVAQLNEDYDLMDRSVMFVSWSGSEQGIIGSNEFVEQFRAMLSDRAIAYINHHMCLEGTKYFKSNTHPVLYDVIEEAAKKVKFPASVNDSPDGGTIFDNWINNSNSESDRPTHLDILGGNDYSPFTLKLGIPTVDFKFTDDPVMPLRHTPYDIKSVVTGILDENLKFYAAQAEMLSLVVWMLGDDESLKYDMKDFVNHLQNGHDKIQDEFSEQFGNLGIKLDSLEESITTLDDVVKELYDNIDEIKNYQMVNDALKLSLRASLSHNGLPQDNEIKYMFHGPSHKNLFEASPFPGIGYILSRSVSDVDKITALNSHINELCFLITSSARVISSIL